MVFDSTTERARAWALDQRHLLADGLPACAHGLYLMTSCPGLAGCRGRFKQLDHARIWVPATPADGRPFVLSHPYSSEISDETAAYADAHGLAAPSYPQFGDGWYGNGTLPIRFTLPEDWPLWPIEAAAAILLSTQPVAWPETR